MLRFIAGILTTLAVLAALVFGALKFGFVPATADVPPPRLEKMMANMALDATIAREAPRPPYPYAASDAGIIAGAKLYAQHCAMCHGAGSGDPPMLSRGLYIRPPQFAKHGVDDDPEGETYWKIEHGIRFTAMPSYKDSLSEEQIWQLTYFMKNLPAHLPEAALAIWHKPVAE